MSGRVCVSVCLCVVYLCLPVCVCVCVPISPALFEAQTLDKKLRDAAGTEAGERDVTQKLGQVLLRFKAHAPVLAGVVVEVGVVVWLRGDDKVPRDSRAADLHAPGVVHMQMVLQTRVWSVGCRGKGRDMSA